MGETERDREIERERTRQRRKWTMYRYLGNNITYGASDQETPKQTLVASNVLAYLESAHAYCTFSVYFLHT